jgi:hypothetical protein
MRSGITSGPSPIVMQVELKIRKAWHWRLPWNDFSRDLRGPIFGVDTQVIRSKSIQNIRPNFTTSRNHL